MFNPKTTTPLRSFCRNASPSKSYVPQGHTAILPTSPCNKNPRRCAAVFRLNNYSQIGVVFISDIFNMDFIIILLRVPGVFIAIGVHEYVKALVAYKLGDAGVKTQGRLTINPLKHMDVLGSVFMAIWGFGWANPVKITPFAFGSPANKRKAMTIIFAVPFLVNIILGMVFALAASLWAGAAVATALNINIYRALIIAARLNISFALFNLLPIYPLDGLLLLTGISQKASIKVLQAEKFLQIALAFFIILGGANIFFNPFADLILSVF